MTIDPRKRTLARFRALIATSKVATALVAIVLSSLISCDNGLNSIERGFNHKSRLFHSNSLPAMSLTIPGPFEYAGRTQFPLKGVAWVDRHIFIESHNDTIDKLIILQFEGYLDSAKGQYNFGIPKSSDLAGSNYRYSPEPIRLGSRDWIHNTWAFDHLAGAIANPESESAQLLSFLSKRGLHLNDELIMSRYVRAVGTDKRNELILFYLEPLSIHGHSLEDFPDGEPPSAIYDHLSAMIVERSERIFKALYN